MYKKYLALKDLQWLIWHKTKPKQTKQVESPLKSQGKAARNIDMYLI